jgi:hypothetical protein
MMRIAPAQSGDVLDDLWHKETPMSNPGAKQFQQVHLTIDVWVDTETSDSSAWIVAENVDVTARNAVEAAMKEIEAPDHGIEVVVRGVR